MKAPLFLALALLSHLCACSTPGPSPKPKPADLGRVAIHCRAGNATPSVNLPATAGQMFVSGTASHASAAVRSGVEITKSGQYAGIIGFPLMMTALASPVTGLINSTRGKDRRESLRHQAELKAALEARDWSALMAAKLKHAAKESGKDPVFSRSGTFDPDNSGRETRCAAARAAGADTLAEMELYGPSLAESHDWAQREQVRVALRVAFVNTHTAEVRRTVWIQSQDGPKRSLHDWSADNARLAAEVNRAMDKTALQFAEKLSAVGISGEV